MNAQLSNATSAYGRAIDPARFRSVMAHYPTGVCVITARTDTGDLYGMTVGSFTSVSLEPMLIAFFIGKHSLSWARMAPIGRFCVNVLASGQEQVSRRFSSRASDKFDGVGYTISESGNPVLNDVVAAIECEIQVAIDAGDHLEVRGTVVALHAHADRRPLLFLNREYGSFQPASGGVDTTFDHESGFPVDNHYPFAAF